MLETRLNEYINDVENPETNYNLAIEYKKIGQTAAAISYFIRCADRSGDNLDLAYESLLHVGDCFDGQKHRLTHAYGCFKQAISILPERPEAYYIMSRVKNWHSDYEDGYYLSSLALKICDFDNLNPLRNFDQYTGIHCLYFEKALSSWHWGKVEGCKNDFLDLCDNYWDVLSEYQKNVSLKYLEKHYSIKYEPLEKYIKNTGEKKIVDCFPFFNEKELLELRVNLLKDHVDEFIITELNVTHSGKYKDFHCKNLIKELNLPHDKINVVEVFVDNENLSPTSSDIYNASHAKSDQVLNWSRERIQRDAVLFEIEKYDDDTVFILSDCDEIINPDFLPYFSECCRNSPSSTIKVPLVPLESRADKRLYEGDTACHWDQSLVLCTKKQLISGGTPTRFRSGYENPFPPSWILQDGEVIMDCGWHFSWMGDSERRKLKSESIIHASNLEVYDNLSSDSIESLAGHTNNFVLKDYPIQDLPQIIFDMPRVKEFLLPEIKENENSIKVVFLEGYPQEELWEYDYITKSLLPQNKKIVTSFEKFETIKNSSQTCDVFVYSARIPENNLQYFMPTYDEVLECVLKIKPKVIIQLSDEFFIENLNDHNKLAKHCKLFLRQYHFEHYTYEDNVLPIPLGYGNEISIPDNILRSSERFYAWTNVGKLKSDRMEMINVFKDLSPHYQVNGISKEKMTDLYLNSVFVPCGRGNSSLNCFRLYESSMCGAIPVVVGEKEEIDWTFKYEENPPWIFADSWENAIEICKELLQDGDKLDEKQSSVLNWWSNRINNVKEKISLSLFSDEKKSFSISSNNKPTVWVVDNFYEDPDSVREFALNQDYHIGGIGRGYIGNRTHQQFLFPGLKERFEEIMGQKITEWESHGMNGRFQYCWSGQPRVWHCDSQKWGGMIYLTPNAPYECGTTLYAHKKTRARNYFEEGYDSSWIDIPGDPHLDGTPFEPVDVMGNVYNRLVIFDASSIHSASEYFGTVKENGRLWQMFFFDT